jgi:thioredoxin reductase (NADPH)
VVYLANLVSKVWLIIRGPDLNASMSRYLVDRITGLPNVEVVTRAQVSGLDGGNGTLEEIRWRVNGDEVQRPIRHLFLFIGAEPNTDWLSQSGIALDPKGFVLTGDMIGSGRHPLETSRRGVFAIGDARAGSIKRVAASVGEGAQVVATLHAYLAAAGRPATASATV